MTPGHHMTKDQRAMSTLSASHRSVRPVRVRWDRVVGLFVLGLLVVWLVGAGLIGPSKADTPLAAPLAVVIQQGDTVWDMARSHAPVGMSTLEYVMLVEQHNSVRSGSLVPGSVLELPQG